MDTVADRLKSVAGRQTLTLTHYGRKTGKPYNVTIWFVVDGDKVILGTANVNRQWVRNVQKTPHVKLSIGGDTFEVEARYLTDRAERERAMKMVRRKYWMFLPILGLGVLLMAIGIIKDNTGAFEVTLG
ncbi:MAG TPA: nitroreductase family deazaflavin-dependent oxidoreductase [Blastocatellia bacterium]|nr:nitroreductase family deazaflavin-dependent oxidoreductase [Blastocatellia bacterium]